MKIKINSVIFILLFLLNQNSYAQEPGQQEIDSLLSALSVSKEDTSRVTTLLSITRFFRYKDHDTAFYYNNHALSLATKLKDEMAIANSKLSLGGLLAEMGRCDEGAKSANEALELYKKLLLSAPDQTKKKLLRKTGRAYGIIGHNRIAQGNYPEGLKNSLLALKIFEELGEKDGIASYEWNIGNIYSNQHNYSDALKHYAVCLEISLASGNKNDIASAYGAIGFIYIQQGKYSEALENYSIALKLAEQGKDAFTLAETYINLGTIYEKQGNFKDALKYNFAALKRYLEIGIDNQASWAYIQIGSVYMQQKKYKDASTYLTKSLSLAQKVHDLEYIKLSYENWTLLDSAQGNYKKALEHYKLAVDYRDSLINEGNTKKLVQQQMQYEFDKKETNAKAEQEKKDAIAQKELQKQKLVRNGFVGGFAIVLLFAGVFFRQRNKITKGKRLSDELLLNILPSEVAEELKVKGSADAKQFDQVTVMFTDFNNFTQISEQLTPKELVAEIHSCFKAFDEIIGRHHIEKIKTIGDSYMCAGGMPVTNETHAEDVINAALEMQTFMKSRLNDSTLGKFGRARIGIHTGPVVAGIVGVKKFAYDIWGDTVNIASRMESSGEEGKVNISGSTYELVKDLPAGQASKFMCEYRGEIEAKGKGKVKMYFVTKNSIGNFGAE